MEISQIISNAIYGIAVFFLLIGVIRGLLRGFGKEFLSLLTLALSAVASFTLCTRAYAQVHDYLAGKTVGALLAETQWQLSGMLADALNNLTVDTAEIVFALPITIVVLPIAFVTLTLLLQFVLGILRLIIDLIFFRGKKNGASRLGGMLLGVVRGGVVAALLLLPISGLLSLAKDSVAIVRSEAGADAQVVTLYNDSLKESAENNPLPTLVMQAGGEYVWSSLATVNLDGPRQDMRESFKSLIGAACDASSLIGADFTALTPENEEAVRSLVSRLGENPQLAKLVAGLAKAVSEASEQENFTMNLGDPYDGFVLSFLHIFSDSNASNIEGDVRTLAEVYILLSDNGVLPAFTESSDAVIDQLIVQDENGETVIAKVIAELRANERTKPVVTELTKFSVSLMAGQVGIEGVDDKTYESVKSGVKELLTIKKEEKTEEEYKEEVKRTLDKTLKENDIEVSEEIVSEMAQYVSDNYEELHIDELEDLDDDKISDVLLSYYDAYLKLQAGELSPEDLPELP